jgi:hypothetical protein
MVFAGTISPLSVASAAEAFRYTDSFLDYVDVSEKDGMILVDARHVQTKRYLENRGYPTTQIPSCTAAVRFTNDILAEKGSALRVEAKDCRCEDTLRGTGRCFIRAEFPTATK